MSYIPAARLFGFALIFTTTLMVIDLILTVMQATSLSKAAMAARLGVNERTLDRHIADPGMQFQPEILKLIKALLVGEVAQSDRLSIAEREYLLEGVQQNVVSLPDEGQQKIILAEIKLARERLKVRKQRNKRGDDGNV